MLVVWGLGDICPLQTYPMMFQGSELIDTPHPTKMEEFTMLSVWVVAQQSAVTLR